MKKIIFVADFFAHEIKGGAEIYDDILLSLLHQDDIRALRIKSESITPQLINLYRKCGFHFIISNFTALAEHNKQTLISEPNTYSILEHDHKYIIERDPSGYKDFIVPSHRIVHRAFYANAKNVFAQSKIHAEVISKNLHIHNVINLGMSLWSEEQIKLIRSCVGREKQDLTAVIMRSSNPIKNTQGAIDYCLQKNLKFELIGSLRYIEFLDQLAKGEKFVFFPRVLESFNRVLLEARMLGCKIVTNNLNGCTSEDWFKEYKGKELVDFVDSQRNIVYNKIKDSLFNEKRSKNTDSASDNSNVTVVLNAYRRPYNLQMQIDAIKNQTHPPKQIWLWVNYHEDNKNFDFKSLDVDRIFHNDYNWKFYGRFSAALLADTDYVALYDDDTIPGTKWHENCLNTMKTHEGILGSAGVILNGTHYVQHDRCGWPTQNPEITEVDLVGHAWFFKREWLRYLWQEKPTTWENGEDIQFAFMAKIHGGIPTYCPPHPPDDKSMHGSVLGNELGIDEKATSTNSTVSHKQFFSQRDECVQAGLRKGWETVREIKL